MTICEERENVSNSNFEEIRVRLGALDSKGDVRTRGTSTVAQEEGIVRRFIDLTLCDVYNY